LGCGVLWLCVCVWVGVGVGGWWWGCGGGGRYLSGLDYVMECHVYVCQH
jgi:hypothetical protein